MKVSSFLDYIQGGCQLNFTVSYFLVVMILFCRKEFTCHHRSWCSVPRTSSHAIHLAMLWLYTVLSNLLFTAKGTASTIMDKSSWDNNAVFNIFVSFLGSLIKTCILFKIFLQFSLPQPITKLKLGKKSWIHASNFVCRVRGGVGPLQNRKRPRNAKVSQDFCP